MPFLAELAEREATGEKARIYAEMRRLGGVPMVALIFRHLATLPGGIEWAWAALEPAWKAGRLQEAAWKIAGEAPLEALTPIPSSPIRKTCSRCCASRGSWRVLRPRRTWSRATGCRRRRPGRSCR